MIRVTAKALALIFLARAAIAEPSADPQYLVFWLTGSVLQTSAEIKGRLIDSSMQAFANAGGDPRELQPLARHIQESMKANNFAEAEATMDRILAIQRRRIGGPDSALPSFNASEIDKGVADLVARIGTTGDGNARKLGFGLAIPTFILEKQIPDIIKAAFRVARERDVAVH